MRNDLAPRHRQMTCDGKLMKACFIMKREDDILRRQPESKSDGKRIAVLGDGKDRHFVRNDEERPMSDPALNGQQTIEQDASLEGTRDHGSCMPGPHAGIQTSAVHKISGNAPDTKAAAHTEAVELPAYDERASLLDEVG